MNTEGLSDEAVSSLLAMPSPEEEKQRRSFRPHQNNGANAARQTKQKAQGFPKRSLSRRQQMMELGEGEMPAATVIRSSRAPKIRSASSMKKGQGKAPGAEKDMHEETSTEEVTIPDNEREGGDDADNADKMNHRPVMISDYIRERPVVDTSNSGRKASSSTTSTKPRESRFKQRNRSNNALGVPTAGGFPSLDIAPVGSFTRRGRSGARVQNSPKALDKTGGNGSRNDIIPTASRASTSNTQTNGANAGSDDVGRASESMLAHMSLDEIRDGVDEVKSILSVESIAFLRRRAQQKQAKKKKGTSRIIKRDFQPKQPTSCLTKDEEIQLEEKKVMEEKEKTAELLSSVRTSDDMDRVYQEALQLGLAAELPSSSLDTGTADVKKFGEGATNERVKNLHIATSLLRSTAPRQRLLGARSLCDILEEDVNELAENRREHSFSDSHDERQSRQKAYPQLLPVAIRCLLDESIATFQTPGGRLLLSIVLRCIHALMTLFVHPYHTVNVSPGTAGCDDPFVLYQSCFMSDVSHVPPGTGLYPPTQIKPLDQEEDVNNACYRADSSAATAESDSKSFYNDPAWTLLSRMRVLPCLSDVLLCLSTDYSTGTQISDGTIRSICGILAMLAVRSPGAAGAIARHKGILPFLVSYCLSPSSDVATEKSDQSKNRDDDDDDNRLFNTEAALPALILLCHLARQSRDIAELEMPYQTIIPDLQAISCVEAYNDKEVGIQIWSLILLRVLMRYGLAIEHVQSLISIAAPRVERMRPESSLDAQYLHLFANICDASKIIRQNENSQNMHPIPEADDCVAMSGVWLASSSKSCVTSFQTVVSGSSKNHMKLASAQLRLLASYISTAAPTMTASSIPMLSKESCLDIIEAALESDMLDNALTIALSASFNAYWDTCDSLSHSLEEEAIGCSLVSSFMSYVKVVGQEDDLGSALKKQLIIKIINSLERFNGRNHSSRIASVESDVHPARQSWFIEAEFSVLSILCEASSGLEDDIWHLLSTFAFSLVGRLNMGHEAMAEFIFRQKRLFDVKNEIERTEPRCLSLQTLFLSELSFNERKLQLNHSSNMQANRGSLTSLRCTADFVGGSSNGDGERFFLPLGGIWMWNVLSSTMTSQSDRPPNALNGDGQNDELLDIVSHTLCLLLQLETASHDTFYASSIDDGTKLYHLTSVCFFPETILSNEFVESALKLLFKRFSGFDCSTVTDSSLLVNHFIKACFKHSRLSKESKKDSSKDEETGATEKKLQDLLDAGGLPLSDEYSKDEVKALNDFVNDVCNSYLEYGGQYATFTYFIRLFIRHGFPAKITSDVLTKLNPILHLLTIEEEDRETLFFSLVKSVSGGLPSLDSSRRDSSGLLDSFSSSLKKKDKELSRIDYVYLLAVAILSRNLASSLQSDECGLQAMKNRMSGMSNAIFYDIMQVSEKFLRSGNGTKDSLISCVLDSCMNTTGLGQDSANDWQWDDWQWDTNEAATWDRVVKSLKGITLPSNM